MAAGDVGYYIAGELVELCGNARHTIPCYGKYKMLFDVELGDSRCYDRVG